MSPLRPPTAARRPGFALAAVLVSCSAAHGQLAASSTGIALGAGCLVLAALTTVFSLHQASPQNHRVWSLGLGV